MSTTTLVVSAGTTTSALFSLDPGGANKSVYLLVPSRAAPGPVNFQYTMAQGSEWYSLFRPNVTMSTAVYSGSGPAAVSVPVPGGLCRLSCNSAAGHSTFYVVIANRTLS